MINTSDLRIGNFILDDEGKLGRITAIDPSRDYLEDIVVFDILGAYNPGEWSAGWSCDFEKVVGVPITEEWLKRFGFSEDVPGVFVKGFLDLEQLLKDSPEWGVYVHEKGVGRLIKYIHQLQNIFHALTGKELIFSIEH